MTPSPQSAVEAVGTAFDAARADVTNSFISLDDSALTRAESVDQRRSRGEPVGRLAGVPIAVKDVIDHLGRTTSAGSSFYRHLAENTAPSLARLEQADAVVVGRTGLHEFAFGFSSENPWSGPVRNPWDHTLSPGGSSGGSAAAVAAGIVSLALGTDTGGSIRVPAALCGVIGLKVTHGRIPLSGVFPLVPSLDTVGAIGSDLDGVATATALMAGDDEVDPWASWRSWVSEPPPPAPSEMRFAVPRGWIEPAPISSEVAAAFAQLVDGLRASGAEVVEADLAELVPTAEVGWVIGPEVAAIHREWRTGGEPYGDDVGARVDAALDVTMDQAVAGATWRAGLTKALRRLTADGTIVVTPTVAGMDKKIGVDTIDGKFYRPVLSWFTAPVNQSGCPALSIPIAGAGRTPSVQLVGDQWSEATLIATARALETARQVGVSRWSSD